MQSKRAKYWLFLGGLGLFLVASVGFFHALQGVLSEPYLFGVLAVFCLVAAIAERVANQRSESVTPGVPLAQQLSGAVGWFGAVVSVVILIILSVLAVLLRL